MILKRFPIICLLYNTALAYVVFMLTRLIYVAENWSTLGDALAGNDLWSLVRGSLLFDTSALCYLNALIVLLILFPLHWKERPGYQQGVRLLYTVFNGLGVILNLCDAVYFAYTGRRTTATIFSEFENEGNMTGIFGTELLRHWYLLLSACILIWGLYRLYRKPEADTRHLPSYYTMQTLSLALIAWLVVGGMRGGFTHAIRPITISNANQYVAHPTEAAMVLNTPFSLIRTMGKKTFVDPKFFEADEAERIYSPVHTAVIPTSDAIDQMPTQERPVLRNVVVLICESLAQEYYGFYNRHLEQGGYQGYTPFLDSLCTRSLTFEYNYSNGRKSIDGMPSILSSIPMFVEPFFLTPASLNDVGGLARSLDADGYATAFFHGAENGSMGFEAFARATGFRQYYGRTEFNADPQFDGDKDFDGMWAIWDEPFLQYYCKTMGQLEEPFMTAVFTASSHHPFNIPEQYRDTFPEEGGLIMHKCIRYLDHSLRRFFEAAAQQPWFDHTLFVITGDHTNLSCHAEYQTDLGLYCVPVIFFDPSGEVFQAEHRDGIAQQIDIMPTLLSALHREDEKPYVAFGCDLLSTPDSLTWAINYNNGIYQYIDPEGGLLQFDGQHSCSRYDLRQDWMLQHNLIGQNDSIDHAMEQRTKAIIQSYMDRMINNKLME